MNTYKDLFLFIFLQEYFFFQKVPMAGMAWIAWNLFDFPAGILPVSKVTGEDEQTLESSFPTNDMVFKN